ncbi:Hypothetical protein R9X50_00416300 [Acrodontium crateriforme]|uniref:Uncharacterized protein n=1 Tax=Acrodontium crateriforme TaxID=150365 RepID=A0AAQ3M492_9PEZI|nr:Hypothetical protein R9X50_00416300 [Acrodontium crateriforme]
MALWTTAALVGLPLLSYTAVYGTFVTSANNGLWDMMGVDPLHAAQLVSQCDSLQKVLPTAQALWHGSYELYIKFFTPIGSLDNISLHVEGLHFFAVWMSAWILVYMEAFRKGPLDPAKTFVALSGVLMELIGIGVTMPWWCLINIVFSHATASARSRSSRAIPAQDLAILPYSLFIGAGVTALFMNALKPPHADPWIIARLYHPAISVIAHRVLRMLGFGNPTGSSKESTKAEQLLSAQRMDRLYQVAFWLTAIPHITTLAAFASVHFFPEWIPPHVAAALAPELVWPIHSPWFEWGSLRVGSIASGIGIFLFWDEAITGAAILLWALVVNRLGLVKKQLDQTPLWIVCRTLALTVAVGPSAAAVMLIKERDDNL